MELYNHKKQEEHIMRDFNIDLIWAKLQIAIAGIGGWLGYALGGRDGLLIALVVLMGIDYLTGIMCAIADKKLSSAVGFKGICKKVLIMMLVTVVFPTGLYAEEIPAQEPAAVEETVTEEPAAEEPAEEPAAEEPAEADGRGPAADPGADPREHTHADAGTEAGCDRKL